MAGAVADAVAGAGLFVVEIVLTPAVVAGKFAAEAAPAFSIAAFNCWLACALRES